MQRRVAVAGAVALLAHPVVSLHAQLSAAADLGTRFDQGALEVQLAPPPFGAFRFTTEARLERLPPIAATRSTGALASTLSARTGSGGAWLGLGAEVATGIDRANPLLLAGLWRQLGAVTFSLGAESHVVRLTRPSKAAPARWIPSDSAISDTTGEWEYTSYTNVGGTLNDSTVGGTSAVRRWSDITARAAWTMNRVAIDARLAMRPRVSSTPIAWTGRAAATVALTHRVALLAVAGADAERPWFGMPASRYVSLGLRVSPATFDRSAAPAAIRPVAAAFAIRPDGAGAYTVSLRVVDARRVEISGDFNAWQPIALHEVQPGRWETSVALTRGTHRINVRVNGDAWTAPPGLPATDDEFNGTVGLLVVP